MVRLIAALLLSIGATTAHAHCDAARTAPQADRDHPSAGLAQDVWRKVYGVFFALTGRPTDLVVLDDRARLADGKPFPGSAFLCPATDRLGPTVYVTWPLIVRAQTESLYDVDFIALVLGHELGHRVRDLTFEGARATAEGGPEIEGRADLHGAFFAALAGYSTRRLACDAALDTFLDVEAHVGESARATRRAKLAEALRAFDVYESLYQASTHLLFGDASVARLLLSWVDKHLARRLEPIPEFKVLLALSLMAEAAPRSPAARYIALDDFASSKHLKCGTIYPQHTALYDDLISRALKSERGPTRDGASEIEKAKGLLRDAERLGASPLAVASSLACAEALLGDTAKATTELTRARTFARDKALTAALDANAAFITWVGWMKEHPAPLSGSAGDKKAWAKAASSQSKTVAAHRALSQWVAALASWPKPPATPPAEASPQQCPKVASGPGWTRLPSVPGRPKSGPACCCGWLELHHLDDDLSASDPEDGVRTCVPAGWGVGLRWVDLRLPLGSVDKVALLIEGGEALSGPLGSLEHWQAKCQSLTLDGTSDRGQGAWRGECPALNADKVVLMADGCRVVSALLLRAP